MGGRRRPHAMFCDDQPRTGASLNGATVAEAHPAYGHAGPAVPCEPSEMSVWLQAQALTNGHPPSHLPCVLGVAEVFDPQLLQSPQLQSVPRLSLRRAAETIIGRAGRMSDPASLVRIEKFPPAFAVFPIYLEDLNATIFRSCCRSCLFFRSASKSSSQQYRGSKLTDEPGWIGWYRVPRICAYCWISPF